jgi:hypothetical protein
MYVYTTYNWLTDFWVWVLCYDRRLRVGAKEHTNQRTRDNLSITADEIKSVMSKLMNNAVQEWLKVQPKPCFLLQNLDTYIPLVKYVAN